MKKRLLTKQTGCMLAAALLAASALAGCGSAKTQGGETGTAAGQTQAGGQTGGQASETQGSDGSAQTAAPAQGGESAERPELELFIINGSWYEDAEKDSVWLAMEDAANVTIDVTGQVNNDDYYTTLSPRLNSATDIPDVFFSVPGGTGGAYATWANENTGILYDWLELLAGHEDEYPYLYKLLTSDQYKNVMFEGRHTLLPYPSEACGWSVYYRGDWLVKIGYYDENDAGEKVPRVPVTMDEFEDVMMKFSDPQYELNPQGKTYGMSPQGAAYVNHPLYHAFGVPTDYDLDENDQAEFMFLTDEYKEYLAWFKKCYDNGWVDPQFYTNDEAGSRKAFEEGRSGILITNGGNAVMWSAKPMEDVWGKGTCVIGPPPVGTATLGKEGAGGWSNWGGMWGGFSVTLACEDTDAVLRLYNYLLSPEGAMTRFYGVEGTHWVWNDTKTGVVANLENRAKEPEGSFSTATGADGREDLYGNYRLSSILAGDIVDWDVFDELGSITIFVDYTAVNPEYAYLMEQGAQYNGMLDTSRLVNFGVLTEALQKKSTEINDICNTYSIQAMVGQKNLDSDWDAMVAECEAAGLEDVYTAYEEGARQYGIIQ